MARLRRAMTLIAAVGAMTMSLTGLASATPVTAKSVAPPAACKVWGCAKISVASLGHGYTIALYGATKPKNALYLSTSVPILRLAHNGVVTQWLPMPTGAGTGVSPRMTCHTNKPSCAVTVYVGAHSGMGSIALLSGSKLVSATKWNVFTDTPGVVPIDLNHDGYFDFALDVDDYTPDYATGGNYWQTIEFTPTKMVSTGCGPDVHRRLIAPSKFETGKCPVN